MVFITKAKTINCDVCNGLAEGDYSVHVRMNGVVIKEMYCPHDLCIKHMELWQQLCSDQEYDKDAGPPSLTESKAMLEEFMHRLAERGL